MRAVVLEAAGPQPLVRDVDVPAPRAGPGEALVQVAACGFSHHDALIMAGALRRGVTLPRVLGHEAAGSVVEVGDRVDEKLIGEQVVVLPGDLGHRRDGAFAELIAAPIDALVPLSAPLDATSALLVSPIGAALKAVDSCGLASGETLVVTGVSGGLGASAAQVAHLAGTRVIGLTGSPHKVAALEAQPWLDAVLLESEPWEEAVAAIAGDAGADAALDAVGASLSRLVGSLRRRGRLVLAGQIVPGEARLTLAEAIFRELTIIGSLGAEREHVERAQLLRAAGRIEPAIDEEPPLSARGILRAYGRLRRREVVGRIVFRP